VVYAIVAWLLIQIAATVEEPLGLPGWFDSLVIVLLAIGFPIAIVLSWAFDVTPRGIVRDDGTAHSAARPRTFEYGLIALIVAAIGIAYLAANKLVFEADSDRLPNSVAVLPFANLSPDPDNAFYADGVHETILTELAKISDMNVIARTTMERYRDSDLTLAEIANELHVGTIMEGSFQFDRGNVRITAQLIDPMTGSHLWSENYDRPFDNIFEIQTDIATSIAMAVEAELLPDERRRIEALPTSSPEAYQAYLRAAAIGHGPGVEPSLRATAQGLLDLALSFDPMFADAYAQKARLYDASLSFDPIPANGWESYLAGLVAAIRENAERAIELNPDLSLPYFSLSDVYSKELRELDARTAMDHAVALAPSDPATLIESAWLDLYVEDFPAAIARAERAVELSPEQRGRLGMVYLFAGQLDRAIEEIRYAIALDPSDGSNHLQIATIEIRRGNIVAALEALETGEALIPESQYLLSQLAFLYALAGDEAAARRVVDRLRIHSERFHVDDLSWTLASLAVGDRAEAVRRLEAEVESDFVDGSSTHRAIVHSNVWDAPVLNEPDFAALRSRLGID